MKVRRRRLIMELFRKELKTKKNTLSLSHVEEKAYEVKYDLQEKQKS